ncbi:MAG: hypothetical protein ACOYMB_02235 [Patescibacteria group bacterium]
MNISLPSGESYVCHVRHEDDLLYLSIPDAHLNEVSQFCILLINHLSAIIVEGKRTLAFGYKYYPLDMTPSFFVKGVDIGDRHVGFHIRGEFLKRPFSEDDQIAILEDEFQIKLKSIFDNEEPLEKIKQDVLE